MYSAKLVGNQMDTVFGLYLPEYEVPAPKVQTNYKEVPYRDGAIDKTAPDGVVTFEDREWSLVFQKTGEDVSAYDVPALSASLMNAIHGKSGEIIFDDDPNYKWVGRVFVENVQCENNGLIIANISLITQPYKYGIQDIVVTDTIETEVDEYQGSIVSFEYSLGKELTKLLAHIEPIQDLHGYANPWPAGGGINKAKLVYKTASVSVGYRNLQDNSVTVYTDNTSEGYRYAQFALLDVEDYAGQTLTFTAKAQQVAGSSTPRIQGRLYDSNGSVVGSNIFEKTGTSITHTFTLPATIDSGVTFRVNLYCNSGWDQASETNFYEIQVEVGSTAHDFAPYENICPISGRTGLSVYRTGKNLFGGTLINGYVPLDLSVGTYTVSADRIDSSQQTYFYIRRAASGTTTYEDVVKPIVGSTVSPRTFAVEAGYDYYAWCNNTYTNVKDVQIELGSTATAYEPYNGNTYAVDWSTQAGTVYHGTVDPVTGQLKVTHVSIEYDGSSDESWAVYSAPRFYINRADFTSPGNSVIADIKTNRLQVISKSAMGSADYRFSASDSGSHQFIIRVDSSVNTVALLRTWLSNNPLQVVYELTTPLTYQLTPQEIQALVGTNNVWSNAGEVEVAVSTMDKVTLSNGRKPQSPKISVTSEGEVALMFFVKGTKHIINLAAGEWSVPDLMLFEGDTDVYESGEGTVTYTYKEASL